MLREGEKDRERDGLLILGRGAENVVRGALTDALGAVNTGREGATEGATEGANVRAGTGVNSLGVVVAIEAGDTPGAGFTRVALLKRLGAFSVVLPVIDGVTVGAFAFLPM